MVIDESKVEARIKELHKRAEDFQNSARTCDAIADELTDLLCVARSNNARAVSVPKDGN